MKKRASTKPVPKQAPAAPKGGVVKGGPSQEALNTLTAVAMQRYRELIGEIQKLSQEANSIKSALEAQGVGIVTQDEINRAAQAKQASKPLGPAKPKAEVKPLGPAKTPAKKRRPGAKGKASK